MLMFGDDCFKPLTCKSFSDLRIEPCKNGLVSGLGTGTQKNEKGMAKRIWKVQETNTVLPMISLIGHRDIPRRSLTLLSNDVVLT